MSRPSKPLPLVGDLYTPRPGRKSTRDLTVTAILEHPEGAYIQGRTDKGRLVTMKKRSFDNSYQLKRTAAVIPQPPPRVIVTADTHPKNPEPIPEHNRPNPGTYFNALILRRLQDIERKLNTALEALGLQ